MKNLIKASWSFAALALPMAVTAQTLGELGALGPDERRAYWQGLSEDERDAKVDEWRVTLDSMSAEDKAAFGSMLEAKRAALRAEWDSMSDEDREAARARMRERAENMTPEERDAMRELMRENRQSMSPEQRKAWREKRRERRPAQPEEQG